MLTGQVFKMKLHFFIVKKETSLNKEWYYCAPKQFGCCESFMANEASICHGFSVSFNVL